MRIVQTREADANYFRARAPNPFFAQTTGSHDRRTRRARQTTSSWN